MTLDDDLAMVVRALTASAQRFLVAALVLDDQSVDVALRIRLALAEIDAAQNSAIEALGELTRAAV